MNLAGVIKQMFDGIVSGFHAPSSVDHKVLGLAARQLEADAATVKRWLMRPGVAQISRTCPVEPYRGGVRWHPDDSRLRIGRVMVHRKAGAANPTIDVKVLRTS